MPGPAGDVPIRVYTPDASRPLPGLVYFHGGGWILGSLETHDVVCRALANGGQCVVVSVDYRLGPEHRFPAAIDDAEAATRWVAANAAQLHIDPERIAVAGDSAGGNLAAAVALSLRDAGGPASGVSVADLPRHGPQLRDALVHRERSGLPPDALRDGVLLELVFARCRRRR